VEQLDGARHKPCVFNRFDQSTSTRIPSRFIAAAYLSRYKQRAPPDQPMVHAPRKSEPLTATYGHLQPLTASMLDNGSCIKVSKQSQPKVMRLLCIHAPGDCALWLAAAAFSGCLALGFQNHDDLVQKHSPRGSARTACGTVSQIHRTQLAATLWLQHSPVV
jgi:hypothetical protein